jgi:zinc/manganese transport system ATP-binding protein
MLHKGCHSRSVLKGSKEDDKSASRYASEGFCPSDFMDTLAIEQGSVQCDKLTLSYGQHVAVDSLTGVFPAGSMTAIMGPNGGGKSTLLKALAGHIAITSGTLTLGMRTSNDFAYLPQHHDNDRSFPLSVGDVVAMGLCPHAGFYSAFASKERLQVEQAIKDVGLGGFSERPLTALSGGQWQRVLFARMSLQKASIILLDEPFAAIDTPTMEDLSQILTRWSQEGHTIISVLHDLEIVREVFPNTLLLARQCIAWGPTKEVLTLEHLRASRAATRKWVSDVPPPSSPYEYEMRPDV